ncbi:hypothetical protein B2_54 [Stenotrophomonas phage B2]|nr:hypothetical protein B2_54 [Stenotrophomonas phage B2]
MSAVLVLLYVSAGLLSLAGLGLVVSWTTDFRYPSVLKVSVFLTRWGEYFALGGMVSAVFSVLN